MKISRLAIFVLIVLALALPACSGTPAVTTPRNLNEAIDPFRVNPTIGSGYMLEINPISELPGTLKVGISYFGVYTFTAQGQTVISVMPILSISSSKITLDGYILSGTKYFEAYPVDVTAEPNLQIYNDTAAAMRQLCLATPGCQ